MFHRGPTNRSAMRLVLLAPLLGCRPADVAHGNPDSDNPLVIEQSDEDHEYGESVYARDRLLQIEIELAPEDWEELRYQSRDLLEMLAKEDCLAEPFGSPYTWFEGTVTIDGETMERVEVRKKGLIGSSTPVRPSLKLDFDDHIEGQRFEGVERLTLNNGRQDPSRVRACLGYWLYEDADLPASRCSFAHVTVNGEDLGVYANVEPVAAAMLRRNFGDDTGNLYEGTLSDFREEWIHTFDDKTGESNYSDLARVVEALDQGPSEVVAAVDTVVNLDQFHRAWAMESLIGHWDSYTANTNNFYIYADPGDGRFVFMPWGIDAIFDREEPFGSGYATYVATNAALPRNLWPLADQREAFETELRALIDAVWDEDELEARLDAALELTSPYVLPADADWTSESDRDAYRAANTQTRAFFQGRREQILDELEADNTSPMAYERVEPCLSEVGEITIDFETTWGSYTTQNTYGYGEATWQATLGGVDYPVAPLGAVVGESGGATLLFITGELESMEGNVAYYGYAEGDGFFDQPGTLDAWGDLTSYLLYDPGSLREWGVWAYVGGTVTLDESGSQSGDTVSGRVQMTVYGGE